MIVYVFLYIINMFFAIIAQKNYNKQRILCFLSFASILVVNTIILGLRDFGIGIDTLVYIDDYFLTSHNVNSISSLSLCEGYDKGYLLLAKFSRLFSCDSQSLLIVTEFFIMFFTLLGIHNYKKTLNINIPLFLTLYWLIFLCHSLNLMRQYCAISLLFYGFSQYLSNKKFVYIITHFFAFFLHSSSLIFIIVPIIYELSYLKNEKIKLMILVLMIALILLSIYFFQEILTLITDYHIMQDVYATRYGDDSIYATTSGMIKWGIRDVLLKILPLLMFIQCYQREKRISPYMFFVVALYFISFAVEQVRYVMIYMFRLAHYISIIYILFFSKVLEKKDRFIQLSKYIYILILIATFYIVFINESSLGWSYSYKSKILGL